MVKIFKYKLQLIDRQAIQIPEGGEILTVQYQKGNLCLWALVEEHNPIQGRLIRIFGTGNPIMNDPGNYIATVQQDHGDYVWHIFEESNEVNNG